MKNNEKGFTLAELIVVVAISAVLLTAVGLTINNVFTNKAKMASKTIYNMLGAAQNIGMSKENCYFGLKADSNGNVSSYILTAQKDETVYHVALPFLG